jgi:HK97 family phage prohead protease
MSIEYRTHDADGDEIETRFLVADLAPVGVEEREDGPPTISGMAPPWDSWSEDMGFRERFMPGAFTDVLKSRSLDVVLAWNHDEAFPLGRTRNKTLDLAEGEKGFEYRGRPPQPSARVDEYLTLIRGGYVAGSSFAFTVKADPKHESWATDERGNITRTIHRVSGLYDVSVVTRPAYPRSTVALRRRDLFAAANLTEAERRQIVEREADDQADKLRRIAADRKTLDALIAAKSASVLARMKARGI